jgi:hypothetical protein
MSRRRTGVSFGTAACVLLLIVWAAPLRSDPVYIVDTGSGSNTSIGMPALFSASDANVHFQYLAAQFTISEAVTLDSIEAWVIGTGGSMDVKIRENVNNLPSTNAPPLLSPNSIFSKRYTSLPNFASAGWLQLPQYASVLAAGTYWVTFEPVFNSNMHYSMPGNTPNPLARAAYYGDGNTGYHLLPYSDANNHIGVRIKATPFPGAAFGTATRVIASGGYFSSCCPYSDDLISEGTRDFTPVGTEGPPLTVSYIFVIGSSEIHARGSLVENGLSTGAYSITGNASGAGRGVAYRTFKNLSDVSKTFRVNADLEGSFSNAGGVARAGVYVFDTAMFSATLSASALSAAHFLLDADALTDIANTGHSLSLARFFPAEALLASDLETASFPLDQPSTLPLHTDFVTLAPGGAVTVLFDLAVYAPHGGAVNFGDTLKPAANLLTDTQDAAVIGVVAMGPAAAANPAAASVVLTPPSASKAVGAPATVTATVTGAGAVPIVGATVSFTVTSGPNIGTAKDVKTDTNGEAAFTYSSATTGTDQIQAVSSAVTSNTVEAQWSCGLKGDANADGDVTVADVFYLINRLFAGGPPAVGCMNVNGDQAVDVADVFYLINYLFAGGNPPQ